MGKMGRAILGILQDRPQGLVLSGAVEPPGHPLLGHDALEAAGTGKGGVVVTSDFPSAISRADVAIDFTHALSSVQHAREAADAGKPIVIGSTGLTQEQTGEIRDSANTIACVLSPNMSVGMNLMFRVAADVARVLGDDYDVEIVETHHRFKKDSPSGTAVTPGRRSGYLRFGRATSWANTPSCSAGSGKGSRSPTGPTVGTRLRGAQ
jgi:4-hydroxy-tetrahydrodipicolinate reductase